MWLIEYRMASSLIIYWKKTWDNNRPKKEKNYLFKYSKNYLIIFNKEYIKENKKNVHLTITLNL